MDACSESGGFSLEAVDVLRGEFFKHGFQGGYVSRYRVMYRKISRWAM